MINKKPNPPVYFLVAILLMYLMDKNIPGIHFFEGKISYITGILFLCFGLSMILWAIKIFQKVGTTIKVSEEPSKLVKAGPYAHTRNPIYLGMVIVLFGVFCLMGSSTPLIVVFVFGGIIEDKFILEEERILMKQFGEDYKAYKSKVSRWFPLLTDFAWEKTKK